MRAAKFNKAPLGPLGPGLEGLAGARRQGATGGKEWERKTFLGKLLSDFKRQLRPGIGLQPES